MHCHTKDVSISNKLTHAFFGAVKEIPVAQWNAVRKQTNLFLSLDYLAALEQAMQASVGFNYILFYNQNKEPVAIAVIQLVDFNTQEMALGRVDCRVQELIKNTLFSNINIKIMLCGNLFACGENGFQYQENIPSHIAFHALYKAMLQLQKKEVHKASFLLLKEYWPQHIGQSNALVKNGFRDFAIDVNMVVTIDQQWKTTNDYLLAMNTKFRTRAKSVFKKSESIVVQSLSVSEIKKHLNTIEKLYHDVMNNASFKMSNLHGNAFILLKEALQEKYLFKGYFLNKELIGFSTAFVLDNAIEANNVGLNYAFNKSHTLYQRMLYDYVSTAIDLKKNELHLGRTAELVKSAVGAKPVSMTLYLRHRNRLSNKFIKPFIERVLPTEFELRNPFKKQ